MKKLALVFIVCSLFFSASLADGKDNTSVKEKEGMEACALIARFAYRAAITYDLEIGLDAWSIVSENGDITYFLGKLSIFCSKDGRVQSAIISLSKELTDNEIRSAICMIDCFEHDWIEYSMYSKSEMFNESSDILHEVLQSNIYYGNEYVYTCLAIEDRIFITANIKQK